MEHAIDVGFMRAAVRKAAGGVLQGECLLDCLRSGLEERTGGFTEVKWKEEC